MDGVSYCLLECCFVNLQLWIGSVNTQASERELCEHPCVYVPCGAAAAAGEITVSSHQRTPEVMELIPALAPSLFPHIHLSWLSTDFSYRPVLSIRCCYLLPCACTRGNRGWAGRLVCRLRSLPSSFHAVRLFP